MSEYQSHNIQKMIQRADIERRRRKIRRWFYNITDDGYDLASWIAGALAVFLLTGVVIYQTVLYFRGHP